MNTLTPAPEVTEEEALAIRHEIEKGFRPPANTFADSLDLATDNIIAWLSTRQTGAIPDGWKLVPITFLEALARGSKASAIEARRYLREPFSDETAPSAPLRGDGWRLVIEGTPFDGGPILFASPDPDEPDGWLYWVSGGPSLSGGRRNDYGKAAPRFWQPLLRPHPQPPTRGIRIMKVWALTDGPVREGKYLVVRRDGSIPHWPHFVVAGIDPCAAAALRAYANEAKRIDLNTDFWQSIFILADQYEQLAMRARSDTAVLGTKGSDPDKGPHRIDNPAVIEMMRGNGDLTTYVGSQPEKGGDAPSTSNPTRAAYHDAPAGPLAGAEGETAWLMERFVAGQPTGEWWDGCGWTNDSLAAVRFCRKIDAERLGILYQDDEIDFEPTEHRWENPILATFGLDVAEAPLPGREAVISTAKKLARRMGGEFVEHETPGSRIDG